MSAAGRDQAPLPAGLRERVLAASLLARGTGQTVPAVPEISADEAFARAADAFYGLLGALSDEGWKTEALRGLDVQGLVGHMIGVEYDTHRALAGDPAVADAEHVESTQGSAVRQADRSPALTRDEWHRAAEVTLELARAAGGGIPRLAMHRITLPLDDLLVVRAFRGPEHLAQFSGPPARRAKCAGRCQVERPLPGHPGGQGRGDNQVDRGA